MAYYDVIYGNIRTGTKKTNLMRMQKNIKHWEHNINADKRDGFKVKVETRPGKKFVKEVTGYSATHSDGSFFKAKLKKEEANSWRNKRY